MVSNAYDVLKHFCAVLEHAFGVLELRPRGVTNWDINLAQLKNDDFAVRNKLKTLTR